MALTIGELVGFIRFDPSGVDDGASRAEGRMRQLGDDMGDTANRAGQTAGTNLGDGIVRGADGRLRNAQGQFVGAGRAAGDGFGDGLTDGAADGADQAADQAVSRMDALKVGMAAAGVAAGGALMVAFGEAINQGNITGRLGAQLGATPAEAAKYGKIAGEMYSNGITVDFQTAADAIRATMAAGLAPPGATNAQIQSIATKVADLANTFELDLGQASNAVGQIMKTGLAPNAQSALDVITRGLQVMGPRADDIADTFNEYSTIFRQMGLSAADATGIMAQGMQAGARDTDVVADSLKEFVLIAQDGGKEVDAAFKSIGLNGKEMQKVFAEGGPKSKAALDQVFDALRKVKDPAERSSLALTLFGTKAEDMQKALFAIDPSKAEASLGKVGGAADKMGNSLRDNAGHQIEVFKRKLEQGLVNVVGNHVIPALVKIPGYLKAVGSAFQSVANHIENNKGAYISIASVITTLMLPSLIRWAAQAYATAAANVTAWATSAGAAVTGAARIVAANAMTVLGWIRHGAAAVAAGARVAATWAMMAARSMAAAVRMAASWVIAMGPVGWIIATVIALVALIVANWDTVKEWTAKAWDWVWNKIKAVGQWLLDMFMNWTLPGIIISNWDKIVAATKAAWEWVKNAVMTVVNWILNFAKSAFEAIKTVIQIAWNTIKAVTQSVWNAIKAAVQAVWNGIKSVVSSAINGVKSTVSSVWNSIKSISSSIWNGIKSVISSALNTAKSLASGAVNSIKGFFSSGFNAVKNTVSNAISGVVSTIRGLSSKVKSAVSGAAQWLVSAGKSIIQGLISGIKSMAGAVGDAVKGVLDKARDLLPFSPAKKGPFAGKGWTLFSGRSMMVALAQGIKQRGGKVTAAMQSALAQAKRHQLAVSTQTAAYKTDQVARYDSRGNEMGGVQNNGNGRSFSIQNYYESNNGSATDTARELEWLARARG